MRVRAQLIDADGNPIGVTGNELVISGISGSGGPSTNSRNDTFTTTANGTTVTVGTGVAKTFSLQVVKTGSVSAWSIVLEGSNDNTNFTTILTHNETSPGDGKLMFTGSLDSPCKYFRSRCVSITLGGGTSVTAYILGVS